MSNSYIKVDYDSGTLCCAGCGEWTGTHMDSVLMYARPNGEDGDGVRICVKANGATMTIPETGPGRRHTIVLQMTCEMCSHVTTISFMQHKGQTQVEYR